MQMPGRAYSIANTNYRYGFNGKENDKESPVQYDYGFRIYDPRLVRFKSVDPISIDYPELTPYQFASNRPIDGIDIDGLEWGPPYKRDDKGNWVPDVKAALEIHTAIGNEIRAKHNQGLINMHVAEEARLQAVKQGRKDGDGITWWTKAMVYIAPWWNSTATYSDANDGAVLLGGKNLDGSDATFGDYAAAGIGAFIPLVGGSALKKAGNALIEGTIGVFRNGKEFRELAFKIGKYGHKGTKEYNSVLKAVKDGGNIVANSKEQALQFLKEALPGIADETGKATSKFGYRIDNVGEEIKDGLKQGHQGLHINYYDKENKVNGTILIDETTKSKK